MPSSRTWPFIGTKEHHRFVEFADTVKRDRTIGICYGVTTLLGCPYTSRQATYDLRRLIRKGLIVRLPSHHRYQLTPLGRRVAVLFTKVYGRVLAPGLAELDPRLPTDRAHRSDLAHAWCQLDRRLNQFTDAALTAA